MPKAKLTTSRAEPAMGSTILGNWICLMSRSLLDHGVDRVADRLR